MNSCEKTSYKYNKRLVTVVLCLSCICTLFCTFSLVYLLAEVNKNLNKLEDCTFDIKENICTCYVFHGAEKRLFRFADDCRTVKEDLKNLVYGVCALFGLGCLISVAAGAASFGLLCKNEALSADGEEQFLTTTSSTTQTRESSFTLPTAARTSTMPDKHSSHRQANMTLNKNSIGTQTPNFMMVYSDTFSLDLLVQDFLPPPSYSETCLVSSSDLNS